MPGPDKLMLIRHGEKPDPHTELPPGFKADGTPSKHSLCLRGWQRAGALSPFFAEPFRAGISTPTTIFASATSEDPAIAAEDAKSLRPQETVAPLAERLGIQSNVTVAVGDEPDLVELLKTTGGIVLVAWEHKRIPDIASGFIDAAPAWGDRFDAVWVLERKPPTGYYALTIVNQNLMSGDLPPS